MHVIGFGDRMNHRTYIMRDEPPPEYSVIFDPISKSALIHFGNRVTWLSGPFASYRDAVTAAERRVAGNR
jgi:hypothetical protein